MSVVLAAIVMAPPKPEDVKAGWTGLVVVLLVVGATALLCWSMMRQLRKTRAAQQAGVFGDLNDRPASSDSGAETT